MTKGRGILRYWLRTRSGAVVQAACLVLLIMSASFSFAQTGVPNAAEEFSRASQLYARGRQLEVAGKEAEGDKSFAASLAIVEKLVAANPKNAEYVHLRAWNLLRLGRHAEVVSTVQKALHSIKDYRLEEVMAESLYFLNRNEEALRSFASYFAAAPATDERMSSAYYYVGECYIRLKKFEHADIALSTATMMEKSMFYWWYRLGYVKEMLGQYKQAYEMYGKALEFNKGYKFAQEGRARVKAKAGL
ncbi:MAG: hypothetical protein FD137_256 [Spirochaetes bacterium]|nr:MAG: hypothetical protein FD137_256 [Spirochaetota bacterium]